MSAEVLRRAAASLREEVEAVRRPYCRDEHFKLAVAEWLGHVADDFNENTTIDSPEVGDYMPPAPEATWCDWCGGAIASPDYSAADQRCDCYRWPAALAVARAYLGETPA